MYVIELCGGVAAGKTTIVNVARRVVVPLLERYEKNPFWRKFYKEPERVAFETELSFLMLHYHERKLCKAQSLPVASDFSPVLDRAYAEVTLREGQLRAFRAVYEQVREELGDPSLLVYLRCGAPEQLQRIRRRRRRAEKTIQLEFLEALNRSLERQVDRVRSTVPVLEIDSEHRDFAHDAAVAEEVVQEIMAALPTQTADAGGAVD